MTTYWLSFTLDSRTIGGRDYNERWGALYEAIKSISTNWWFDTTAFAVFESERTVSQVMSTMKSSVSPTYDLVLVRELDRKTAQVFGPINDRDIFKMMPYLEEV